MSKPSSDAPPTNPLESLSEGEWQIANTTRNNRTRNGLVVVMALVAAFALMGWLWQRQDAPAQATSLSSSTPTAAPATALKPTATIVPKTTSALLTGSSTKTAPTRRSAAPKIPTPTPERFGVLSLLRVEQMSPIQAGQAMKVRAYWRVGALPNVGLHKGLFSMQLIGPDGSAWAQSDVQSEGPMRGYRVGGVYAVDHVLDLPLQIGNGEFTLVASIADLATGERWPALMDGQANADYRLRALQFMLPRKGWGPMVWPVLSTSILRGFGAQLPAIDIQETEGQPVVAAMRGCVVLSNQNALDYGNIVEIKSDIEPMDVRVRYSFLSGLRVTAGDCVEQGEVIGAVADSDATQGATKLRVEVLANGQAQNPWDSLSPDPVTRSNDVARVPLPKRYPLTLNSVRVEPLQPKAGEPIKITWWFSGSANHVSIKVYDIDSNLEAEYLHSAAQVDSQRGEMTVRGISPKHAPSAVALSVDHVVLALVPLGASANDAAIQSFEHGSMIWLNGADEIYVLYENGELQSFVDHFVEGSETLPATPPPAGKLQPQRGFGWVWRTYSNVRERLGWALQVEQGYRACVRWLTITDVATKQPSYVTDPNGQVYQLGSDFRLWQYSPGLLGSQSC